MARGSAPPVPFSRGIRRPAQTLDHRTDQRLDRPASSHDQGSRPQPRCLHRLDLARRRP